MRKIDLPPELQPSAAVVGAGISGVHVAKELASIGFRVTVLESNPSPAQEASAFDCGIVVPSSFSPSPWKLRFISDFFLGVLPMSAGSFLPIETPLTIIGNAGWGRWAGSRWHQRGTSVTALQAAGEAMAISSVDAVQECLSQDGRLKSCVLAEVGPRPKAADASHASGEESIDEGGVIINVPGWTKTLAEVCQERLGVRFLYNHKVLRIKTKMTNGIEWAPYLVVKDMKASPHEPPLAMGYDLVVVCAGTQTRDITWLSDPVPIQPFGGYCLDIPLGNSIVGALRSKLGETRLFGNVSPDGWLKMAPTVRQEARNTTRPVLRIAGMASFDDAEVHDMNPDVVVGLFRRRLHLHHGVEIPREAQAISNPEVALTAHRYQRGITPDGLPIVSRLGSMKNVFICSGFGDNGALLAPGAARLLANLVVAKTHEEELTPYSLGRFRAFRYMDPTRHFGGGRSIVGSMLEAEKFLCRVGDVARSILYEHVFTQPWAQMFVPADVRK